jgi:AcrR family transcriptional regulator
MVRERYATHLPRRHVWDLRPKDSVYKNRRSWSSIPLVSRNTSVAPIDVEALPALPPEAQEFWRRARIVDAAVREIAEHGYGGATEAGIAERAGVSRGSFHATFDGKEDALLWAYDAACAYAIPQILEAMASERDGRRAAAAAVATYLAILDCDHAWAVACLQELPAAGEEVRAARDAVRAPVVRALEERIARTPGPGASVDTVLAGLDAMVVDRLRQRPDKPVWARRSELTAYALAPFAPGAPPAVASDATADRRPAERAPIAALLDHGPSAQAEFALLVQAAIARRDGATLWQASVAMAQRRAAGRPVPERLAREALDALRDAWFFGLPI